MNYHQQVQFIARYCGFQSFLELILAQVDFPGNDSQQLQMVMYNYARGKRLGVKNGIYNIEFTALDSIGHSAKVYLKTKDGIIIDYRVIPQNKTVKCFTPVNLIGLNNHDFYDVVFKLTLNRQFFLSQSGQYRFNLFMKPATRS